MICKIRLSYHTNGVINLGLPESLKYNENNIIVYPILKDNLLYPKYIDSGCKESIIWNKIISSKYCKIGIVHSEDWSNVCTSVKRIKVALFNENNEEIFIESFPDYSIMITFENN